MPQLASGNMGYTAIATLKVSKRVGAMTMHWIRCQSRWLRAGVLPVWMCFLASATQAQPPKRDVTVEFRQVEEGREDGALRLGTKPDAPLMAPQKIQVRNGEKGSLRMAQFVQWFEVGQSISVTPRWPGGNKDVTLELDVQQADMAVRHNADMPRQTRNQLRTTVSAPLGQWVTIAAAGNAPARQGSFSSGGRAEARHLLQVRVLVP